MSKNLTKAQALAAYKRVCKALGETPHPEVVEQGTRWPSGPVLCKNFEGWYSTNPWAVVFEGGEYHWSVKQSVNEAAAGPNKTVFAEAITGYALGLYPAL